jgi:hypothetical protein
MSSNTPPTTTSPDRPSTNNPQDLLITPNYIPVVTQTEGNSPFEQLIRAIAINETEHVSPFNDVLEPNNSKYITPMIL